LCPESPYWVRTQDRKQRIRERQSAGFALDEGDRQCSGKSASMVSKRLSCQLGFGRHPAATKPFKVAGHCARMALPHPR
jgi:hypothetical protein